MTFLEFAKERYSVRSFKDKPIETEKLSKVLESARIAPTGHNNQPQRIKIINSSEDLAKIDQCTRARFGAQTVLLVCYDKEVSWKRKKFDNACSGEQDAAIVTTHMMLAAHNLGLGTCWVMFFDPAKTRELFALPENIIPMAMLPIGYPSDDCAPHELHSQRVEIEKLLI